MRQYNWLLRNVSIWLAPFYALICAFTYIDDLSGEGWSVAIASARTEVIVFLTPVVAIASAWEGLRIKSTAAIKLPQSRSRAKILLFSWGITLIIPLTIMVLWMVIGGGMVSTIFVLSSVLTLATWSAIGFALGIAAPIAFSLPLAFVVPLFWVLVPRALNPLWLRHINGYWAVSCCGTGEVLNLRSWWAATALNLGLFIGALGFIFFIYRATNLRILLGVLPIALLGSITGIALVSSQGVRAEQPRTDARVCRIIGGREFCLWPEHTNQFSNLEKLAPTMLKKFEDVGLKIPQKFDEGIEDRYHKKTGDGNTVGFYAHSRASLFNMATNIVSTVIPVTCYDHPESFNIDIYMLKLSGLDDTEIKTRFPDYDATKAQAFLERNANNWRSLQEKLGSCDEVMD